MDFDEYQKLAARTADFKGRSDEYPVMYTALGLAGETGELIEKVKKVIRNDNGAVTEEAKQLIRLEVGDVLWYLSQLSRLLGISFNDAAKANIEKLADRAKRGALTSKGDVR